MKNTGFIANVFFSILCAAFISSKSFAEPMNIHELRNQLQSYHDSGTYLKEITKVADAANKYITEIANTNNHSANPKHLAIVLDVDETSLSYYNHLLKHHFCYDPIASRNEILTANAPAIKPILLLYKSAIQNKVAVFFITARRTYARQATRRNLKAAGYTNWTGLYTRPPSYKTGSIQSFKSEKREEIERQGYTIIASIGDQKSDLSGGYTKKTFKIPNPYYFIN
ncbi:MAG: hypothetical protein A3E88_05925 [Legionellales bacterium RIFCSPHIGHO2_12_FULL_35_11]|nr:MAG: hypothetical protein A3E88_05925 [Legionellales bacterium RIFCSPHIGHO2_12_FULL_35_11]